MTRTQPHSETTRTGARAGRTGPSTGRLVTLVVVLAGLFGMHGLAGHGSHAADAGSDLSSGDAMVAMATPSTTTSSATVAVPEPSGYDATVSGAMSGGAMSLLCLAILTAGALLLLLAARRPRVALARVPAPWPVTLVRSGRDRDPPSLTALSIRRC